MFIKKNKTDIQNINVVFYTKTEIIKEIRFKANSSLREIFDYFRKNIRNEGYSLKPNYKIFSKKVNEYETIPNILKMDKNDVIIEGEIWIEVEENLFLDDENDEVFKKILQPKINPFELIEYSPLKSKIKFIECSKDFILFHSLNKFTKESAFCNSTNSLFISGGEMAGKAINNFWIINKNDYKITKTIMPIEKKYHSMVYIPDSFILIAGGNSLETLIYDIEKQVFIRWANMNRKHFQPALINYGDYVYAFSALNNNDLNKNYFERTNLTSNTPRWEKIFPDFDRSVNTIKLVNHFFAISKSTNGNILFIGGEKSNKNYLYNPSKNLFTLSSGKTAIIPFWDKTFYKISKRYNVLIPLNFCMNYKLGLVNKETQSLYEINCDKKTGDIKFSLDLGKEKISNSGNIYIQTLIKNIKNRQNTNIQIGLNPRNAIKKNQNNYEYEFEYDYSYEPKINNDNYINNDEINLGEEKIIVDNWHSGIDNIDNSDQSRSKNYTQKKSQLIIPDAAVDEQIINRKIDLNGNEDQENINNFEKLNSNANINKNLNNNNFNNDEGITKEELVFIGEPNEEDEDDNKINYYKKYSSSQKPFLYISNSILDDQIINRQLIKNGDEQNENWENIVNKNINEEESEPIDNNQNEDVEEEEILLFNYGNNEYDRNNFSREKTNKNNKCLYIQFSSIDDQITDRKVNLKDIDNKKIKNIMTREDSKPYIRKKVETNKNGIYSAKKNINSHKFFNIENENENDILKESEIIINNDNRLNTEGNEMKTKISKNSLRIYVPEYAIEDQFINREVCPDNN